jgi:high-affinity nickel-transport protein
VTPLSALALGFFLGMRHATDADHVVAVTTIVTQERSMRGAAVLGGLWGVGHTATIVLVGGAIVLFRLVVPPSVGLLLELGVAAMLVVLGLVNLLGLLRPATVAHAHHRRSHPGHRHEARGGRGSVQLVRSLAIGVVHGLAGSAAVAILVGTAIPDARWALLYLAIFGAGTVVGMLLITSALAAPLLYAASRVTSLPLLVGRLTGALSLSFGLYLTYQIGVVDGLFTGNPIWIPE